MTGIPLPPREPKGRWPEDEDYDPDKSEINGALLWARLIVVVVSAGVLLAWIIGWRP